MLQSAKSVATGDDSNWSPGDPGFPWGMNL